MLFFLFLWISFMVLFFSNHFVMYLLLVELLLLLVFFSISCFFLGNLGINLVFVFILVLVCVGGFGISVVLMGSREIGQDFWLFKYIF